MSASHEIGANVDATPDRPGSVVFHPAVVGTFWALFTVIVWGAWPAYTRLAVTQALTPEDLVLLRYGIGGFLLLPILMKQAGLIPRRGWHEGVVLAFFQGAPLALLATTGLRFAPAAHMTALSPSLMPLFTTVFGYLFFKERIFPLRAVGLAMITLGALAIGSVSLSLFASGTWKGDLMFVCAGFMGSIYAVRMRRSGLSAMQGAALISVYSMLFYVPLYAWLWAGSTRLTQVPLQDVLFQALYQGVLMGAVTMFSLSRAIVLLGAVRGTTFLSLLPVLGAVFAAIILHEVPSLTESAAVVSISLGAVLVAQAQVTWTSSGASAAKTSS